MVSGSARLPGPGNGGLSGRLRVETAACAYAATVRKRRGVMAPAAELPNIKTGLAEDSTSRCKFDNFRSAKHVRRKETDTCHFFIRRSVPANRSGRVMYGKRNSVRHHRSSQLGLELDR